VDLFFVLLTSLRIVWVVKFGIFYAMCVEMFEKETDEDLVVLQIYWNSLKSAKVMKN